MSTDAQGQPTTGQTPSEGSGAELVGQPWVDPYTNEVLDRMRAQGPLSAAVDKVRDAAASGFIGSSVNTASNSASVYLHGPRDAAVDKVVDEAAAAGITVHIIDAPFSAAELNRSRSQIKERMQELGISRMGFDLDGGGSTVNFQNTTDLRAAKQALADYEHRLRLGTVGAGDLPAIAALYASPGSPAIHISDELSDPQDW